MHGRSKFKFEDGEYDGEWKGGFRHGDGTFRWNNGDVYEGKFSHDLKHFRGKYTHANGATYDGQWVRDRIHGIGRQEWPDGDVYEGNYANDKRHGFGSIAYASDGKCSVPGSDFSWSAGDRFDGLFQHDVRHGACTYRFFNGETFTGTWVKGKCPEFTEYQRMVLAAADPQVAAIAHALKTMQLKVTFCSHCTRAPLLQTCAIAHVSAFRLLISDRGTAPPSRLPERGGHRRRRWQLSTG
jgi:hypothetical protein